MRIESVAQHRDCTYIREQLELGTHLSSVWFGTTSAPTPIQGTTCHRKRVKDIANKVPTMVRGIATLTHRRTQCRNFAGVPAESRLDSINGEGRVGETSGSRRWRLYNDMRCTRKNKNKTLVT
ncbi:uncharacterized protein CCOS01_13984 [Colletotrichum costaricense]|uniref:Uncharacterized protein n=1 Tax=Colletotrichum costaricense TaxID=1209916 RepID=A0AAI9YK49_9PEZI|nr:uncharacterized protein CCOS01_13984 [Colletotrichum costaricense]KAK1514044.1 hypothetical protein CCOS01_13984 [Colletotrichum costaricense]